jgi:HSP20 family protein
MTLTRYSSAPNVWNSAPFELMNRLREEVQHAFEAPLTAAAPYFTSWAPALDLYEENDRLVVKLEAPGLKKDAFSLSLHDGVLSISGERKLAERRENARGYRAERFEGRFQRSLALPKQVDAEKVAATYRDGVLTVTLPVAEAARPRQINIQAN